MNIHFAEKLKSLRAQKNVSQEKLAQYLRVSFQAVSKWEVGNAYPDITLLPEIARFFGVSIDELLCVEQIDEKRLFGEYSEKAADRFRCGDTAGALALWQEAYHRMPNSIDVKEMLMSSYFDTDRVKHFDEFYALATEIVDGNAEGLACAMYYKGQAISQLARTFAERGETEEAQKWAVKSVPIFNSMEIIEAMIDSGEDLIGDAAFCTYWFLEELFALACRMDSDGQSPLSDGEKQACLDTVSRIYETVYRDDDAGFEQLRHLSLLHQGIAEYEAGGHGDVRVIRQHLERALACCEKSVTVKEHRLDHPMLYGWQVFCAPSDCRMNLRSLSEQLKQEVYVPYRGTDWFRAIADRTEALLGEEQA